MTKENDLMLNMLANQSFSITDFKDIGLNASNTSLETEDVYKEHSAIKNNPLFLKLDGSFDSVKFHNYYLNAQQALLYLGDDKYRGDLIKLTTFHRDNIFAPVSLRRKGPDFQFVKFPNPDRVSISTSRLGKESSNPLSQSEIAQTQKVLANPTEAYDKNGNLDESKAIWHDAPNDSFFTDFWNTRVLAQWDEDGEHTDPITKLKVKHSKGLLKTNSNGTYYYENLDGRDVYGKQVLNKFDTLTTDGSAWNKYDFFDSDDKELKSIVGTTMKNLALVGSMYIPYVGPVIAGLSIATLAAGLLGTLGKMFSGSDSPIFSGMEGWALSVNRQTAKTDYAKEHTWCWENFIGLVGDSLAQFKEQRVLFQNAPALFKGKYGIIDETFDYDKIIEKEAGVIAKSLSELAELVGWKGMLEIAPIANLRATSLIDSYIKGYLKLGEIFSKAYMTGITVADTYGEAKAQGASDLEATMLTLGYGAAEATLLNTGLGEWLFPELRYNKMHQEAVLKALTTAKDVTQKAEKQIASLTLKAAKDISKKQYIKDLFNIGKKAALDLWTASKSTGARTLSNAIANASGEGFEEVSEELLADLSKGCFNVIGYLRGDKTRLEAFDTDWSLNDVNTNWKAMFDRYSMNFVGGFVGGGLSGLNLKLIKAIKDLGNMTYDQAVQKLIYMTRNKEDGELSSFIKTLNKTQIGNPNWSATKYTTDADGNVIWAPAEGSDNQDVAAKNMIKTLLKMIDDILTGNGLNISDESLLSKLADLLGDAKYTVLMKNSSAVGRMLQRFNTLGAQIAENELRLRQGEILNEKTDREKRNEEKEESKEAKKLDEAAVKGIKEELKQLKQEKDDLLSGKLTGQYIDAALFELTPMINMDFLPISFARYAESVTKRKYSDLSESELNDLKKSFDVWKTLEKGDQVLIASLAFKDIVTSSAEVILNHAQEYLNAKKDPILKSINDFYSEGIDELVMDKLQGMLFNGDLYEGLSEQYFEQLPIAIQKLITNTTGHPEQRNLLNAIQLYTQINPSVLTDEQYLILKKNAIQNINNLFVNIAYDKLQSFTEPIIKQGYLNSEAKRDLLNTLNHTRELLKESIKPIDAALSSSNLSERLISRDPLIKQNAKLEQENLIKLKDEIVKKDNILKTQSELIANLTHTPIELDLNEFSIAVTGNPTNVSEILAKVNNELDPMIYNLANYTLDGDLVKEINDALKIIDYYRIALDSARTDNGDFNNLFGFAHTVNQLNKHLGTLDYIELPEIDSETAEVLKQDLKPLRDKLVFALKIYNINQGAKIHQQENANLNKDFLLFKKIQKFKVSIPDDWEGKNEFLTSLDSLSTLNEYQQTTYPDSLNSVSPEKKKLIQLEILKLEDSIYNLFSKNLTLDKIKNLLSNGNFDLYSITKDILNENTDDLDDNGFIWWLATRAAVKASDFYKRYSSLINLDLNSKKIIAPIAPQVLAIYQNYASVINGNVFDLFLDAYRQSIKDDWSREHKKYDTNGNEISGYSTLDYRREILEKLNPFLKYSDGDIDSFIQDDKIDNILLYVKPPKYSHITFTEGISGAGKTSAVLFATYKLLEKYHQDSELLKDVWIIHGANKQSGETIKEDLEATEATVYSYKEFMLKIVPGWTPLMKDPTTKKYTVKPEDVINKNGECVSNHQIAKDVKPSLIIIDEITNFTLFDLDDINNLGKQLGILILAAGDTNQSGIVGEYEIPNIKLWEDLQLFNTLFIRSFKLGVSMRPGNNHKAGNFNKLQLFMQDPIKNKLVGPNALTACVNEEGIFGDLVMRIDSSDEIALADNIPNLNITLEEAIEKMINTLKPNEHIGYITNNPENRLAEYLVNKYGDKVKTYPSDIELENSSQGKEFQYSIVDIDSDPDVYPADNGLNDAYTAMTRAIQGDVILTHTDNESSPFIVDNTVVIGDSNVLTTYVNSELSKEVLIDYSLKIKNNYEELTSEASGNISYIPRTIILDETPTPIPTPTPPPPDNSGIPDGNVENDTETENEDTKDLNEEEQSEESSSGETPIDPEEIKRIKIELEKLLHELRGEQWLIDNGFKIGDLISIKDGLDLITEGIIQTIGGDALSHSFYIETDNIKIDESKLTYAIKISHNSLKNELKILETWDKLNNILLCKKGDIVLYSHSDGSVIDFSIEDVILDANTPKIQLKSISDDSITYRTIEELSITEDWTKKLTDSESSTLPITETLVEPITEEEKNPTNSEDFTLETIEELKEEAVLNIVNNSPVKPKITNNYKQDIIETLVYSNFTFETGVKPCKMNEIPELIGSPEAGALRIDSVNGLINLDKHFNRPLRTLGEYLDIIADIREVIFSNKEIGDIINNLTYVIKNYYDNSEEINTLINPKIVFGYRICNPKELEKGNKYDAFNHPKANDVMFIDGSGKTNQNHQSYIGIRIGFDGLGDVLELPLLNLSNPYSILQSKDDSGNYIFEELLNEFPGIDTTLEGYEEGDTQLGLRAKNFYNKYRQSKDPKYKEAFNKYKTLFKLFQLFSITNNAWVSFNAPNSKTLKGLDGRDWTPGKDMNNLGPRIFGITKNRTLEEEGVYEDPEYKLEAEYVTLKDLKSRKGLHMSKIIYSKTGSIEDSNGDKIYVDGSHIVLKKGHPFILYSFSSEGTFRQTHGVNNIYDAWIRQLQDPSIPQTIGMAYVLSPLATIEEFIAYNTLRAEDKQGHIKVGNDFDGYKICRELFTNEEFVNKLISNPNVNNSIIDTVTKLIKNIENNISNLSEEDLIESIITLLNTPVNITGLVKQSYIYGIGDISKGITLKDFFLRVLALIINPIRNPEFKGVTHIQNEELLNLVKEYAPKSLQSLRYHPDAEYKLTGLESLYGLMGGTGANFFGIAHDTNYAINDLDGNTKYYTVIGSMSQDIYRFNPDLMLDFILDKTTGLHYYAKGDKWHSTLQDELNYINREITSKCKQEEVELSLINPNTKLINNVKYILDLAGVDLPSDISYKSDLELKLLQKQAVTVINKNNNSEFAVIINDKAYKFEHNNLESGVFSLFNTKEEYLQDPFTTTESFTTDADGNVYLYAKNGHYEYDMIIKDNGLVEVIPKVYSSKLTYAINEQAFDKNNSNNYYKVFDSINAEDLLDSNSGLDFSFLKAETFEEFIQNLNDNLFWFEDLNVRDEFKSYLRLIFDFNIEKGLVSETSFNSFTDRLLKFINLLLCKENSEEDPNVELCNAFKFTIFNV